MTANEGKASGFLSDFNNATSSVSASSGNCPPDMHLSVMSGSITIPFGQACDFFHFLHLLVICSAYLAAARIVFNSTGKD